MAIRAWVESLGAALQKQDMDAAVELFHEKECFWRDLVAFTWNFYTAESRDEIRAMLQATLPHALPHSWVVDRDLPEDMPGVYHAFLRFETQFARCRGHVRLKEGKCWTLLTAAEELKGHEEKAGPRRERGVRHGAFKGRRTWLDERSEELEGQGTRKENQPYCLIVGGGQAGIGLAARLRRLQVATIVVDKNARPGDSWRNRYKSLCLHDPVWFHHLPFIPFPDHWPVFPPKDKIGDWLEAYTQMMELVYWPSTECKSARYIVGAGEAGGSWEVEVEREGRALTLYPKELVLATGMWGMPNIPSFEGMEGFEGVQLHSSEYKSGEDWKGKHCVVVGSNTSAHDICADLWEHGAARVTMVQRSSTLVAKYDTYHSLCRPYHDENSRFSTLDADLLAASFPFKLLPSLHGPLTREMERIDAPLYRGLGACGFLHDFCEDGAGLFLKYLRRGSGYYLDVGASQLLIDGEVKLISGVGVKDVRGRSVVLSDGSEVEADLVVYATGYGPMNGMLAKLVSREVADRVGKCWGLGSGTRYDPGPWERELRNFWKPTQQPHLWFHGSSLLHSRMYSLYLALQIKARAERIPTPVYALAQVHHTQ